MPSGYYADAGGGGVSLDAANAWTAMQTFRTVDASLPVSGSILNNGDFETNDLTGWADDSTGWVVTGGNLTHTPGATGELTQDISVNGKLYLLTVIVSGMTAGWVEVYDNIGVDVYTETSGTFTSSAFLSSSDGTDILFIDVSEDFDGAIESVSLQPLRYSFAVARRSDQDASGAVYGGPDSFLVGMNKGAGVIETDTSEITIVLDAAKVAFPSISTTPSGLPNAAIWNNHGIFCVTPDNATQDQLTIAAPIVILPNLPTDPTGLPSGALWNDSGVPKIA